VCWGGGGVREGWKGVRACFSKEHVEHRWYNIQTAAETAAKERSTLLRSSVPAGRDMGGAMC
jgi:hypothetical protein